MQLMNISVLTFFGERDALLFVTIHPPVEKTRSDGTDEAGMVKNLRARGAIDE